MQVAIVIPNYNSAALVERSVAAMLQQKVGEQDNVQIVVVDDGSTDHSADALERRFGDRIRLIRLPENRGRSTARNAGAAATTADVLVFIDSDCVPPNHDLISAHLAAFETGTDVSFGAVCTPGDGFWDRLQRDANEWRRRRFDAGDHWTFTTQNVAVRRDAFLRAGGFDPAFERHGFEDRDLFIQLSNSGAKVAYTATAQVIHEDAIGLNSVSRKVGEAGYYAAHLFDAKHPVVYAGMPYSRLDCRHHPYLLAVDLFFWPLARWLARGSGAWLEWRWLPFRLRALMARGVYGLNFLHGTVRRRKESLAAR